MKKFLKGAAQLQVCLFLTVGATAQADDHEEVYVYGTYSVCDLTQQERVDEIFEKLDKPIYDAAVADGTITSYSYYAHHTGGKWSRAFYTMSDSLPGLFAAQNTMMERSKDLPSEAFDAACTGHEDYIWKTEANNGTTGKRGKAGLSVYHVCDINREQKADELVKTVMAPHYDKAVEQGKLTSWGWNSHVVGGKYRRLVVDIEQGDVSAGESEFATECSTEATTTAGDDGHRIFYFKHHCPPLEVVFVIS